jgi:hypothetical protein
MLMSAGGVDSIWFFGSLTATTTASSDNSYDLNDENEDEVFESFKNKRVNGILSTDTVVIGVCNNLDEVSK